ncbi:glycoside hydrolase family 92 protein [Echinicola strongylocentroti]|uniref:Glycoside hydrolase family 92 protein n=1 Tax=Echinicola strongylocentroti TaxID=1795355 RepID=A0A2Z4IEC8_9BACT|nr:GH92 family glycosyl hydrolase [Echinicola strongylocentroti]AWW29195.1 glycoside hydrolase family 92 protein [Echinicola strongylocentroti]
MKKILLTSLMGIMAWSIQAQEDLSQYVDPMIGTAKMGHTYPGATVPFGSVQLSPDTDTIPYEVNGRYNPEVYRYCAGYQYDDATIVGFSHTHFSGTGHSDLGDFLMMPTSGPLQLNPGTEADPDSGYRSRFSHDRENASPAYYQVELDDYGINAELTATTRVGVHRYTFSGGEDAHVILDLMSGIYNYEDKNVWTFMRVENDTLVTGFRETTGWARTRKVFFALSFDKPIAHYGNQKYDDKQAYRGFWGRFNESENFPEIAGRKIRAYFDFDLEDGDELIAKLAISPVSTEGAIKNMQEETPGWDFDAIHQAGVDSWNKELNKVQVNTIRDTDKVNFYTAMYHAFLGPTVYGDVDGKYRGLDMNIHEAEGFTNYTSFSLWDTYRALHPLFNVLQPARNRDMVKSMLAHFDQSVHPMLPIWSHYANENWCMIGYHSASVIADAVVKGTVTSDLDHALNASVTTAKTAYFDGIGAYMERGYVPEDVSGASVSKTLEYAYDDWAIAQMATKIGREDIAGEFAERAGNYKNVFDHQSGFMRPKLKNGNWKQGFDPLDTHGQGFIEGNAWNYSLYVPHAPKEMIGMMGGDTRFVEHLDSLFSMDLPDRYFANTEDISREGIIGNYVHGNEPSHHVVYLYNWTDQAWKSQDKIRMILRAMYQTGADGLGGNDDFGQMSAWYLFSALGFYPVAPGSVDYALGSPLVEEATINLENGNTFTVEAQNQSEENVYVSKVLLNGEVLSEPFIQHADIIKGGKLTFIMKRRPNKKIFSKD